MAGWNSYVCEVLVMVLQSYNVYRKEAVVWLVEVIVTRNFADLQRLQSSGL